jgi:tRNA pseudouridine32 synthase/23S rRNA pseudouridine746 synthase
MTTLVYQTTVSGNETRQTACELLSCGTGLSRNRIKTAMKKGAVWTGLPPRRRRLRRATARLTAGIRLELFYDPKILALVPPEPTLFEDRGPYSVWFKPAGLMTQGNDFGDHCSLVRLAQAYYGPRLRIYPVHRLDREAEGLVLLAHNRLAAAALSQLFRDRQIVKTYRAQVLGNPASAEGRGTVDLSLDGKQALTVYRVAAYDPQTNTAVVEARLETGRRHQLRRHLAAVGHPVMGDPRYGTGNKNSTGLKLAAVSLAFRCPFTQAVVFFTLDADLPATGSGGADPDPGLQPKPRGDTQRHLTTGGRAAGREETDEI